MSKRDKGKGKSPFSKPRKLYTVCQASFPACSPRRAQPVCGITEHDQQRAAAPCLKLKVRPWHCGFPRKCRFKGSLPKQSFPPLAVDKSPLGLCSVERAGEETHPGQGPHTPCASVIQLLLEALRFGCGWGEDSHMSGPPLLYRRQPGLGGGGGSWAQRGEPRGCQTVGGGHPDSMASVPSLVSHACAGPQGPTSPRPPEQSLQANVLKVLEALSTCVSESQRVGFLGSLFLSCPVASSPWGGDLPQFLSSLATRSRLTCPVWLPLSRPYATRLTRKLPMSSPSLWPRLCRLPELRLSFLVNLSLLAGVLVGARDLVILSGDNILGSNQPLPSL